MIDPEELKQVLPEWIAVSAGDAANEAFWMPAEDAPPRGKFGGLMNYAREDLFAAQLGRIAELEAVLENVKALAFELQALSEVKLTAVHPQYAHGHSDGLAIAFVKLRAALTPKEDTHD